VSTSAEVVRSQFEASPSLVSQRVRSDRLWPRRGAVAVVRELALHFNWSVAMDSPKNTR